MGRDSSTGTEVGLLAQQVETIAPDAVETVKLPDEVPEFKSIKIEKVFFKMLGALQESQQRIEDLEARIEELESNTLQPVYATLADLPDASEHHGKTAHVHAEGALYFAHAGNWVKLQNA